MVGRHFLKKSLRFSPPDKDNRPPEDGSCDYCPTGSLSLTAFASKLFYFRVCGHFLTVQPYGRGAGQCMHGPYLATFLNLAIVLVVASRNVCESASRGNRESCCRDILIFKI